MTTESNTPDPKAQDDFEEGPAALCHDCAAAALRRAIAGAATLSDFRDLEFMGLVVEVPGTPPGEDRRWWVTAAGKACIE